MAPVGYRRETGTYSGCTGTATMMIMTGMEFDYFHDAMAAHTSFDLVEPKKVESIYYDIDVFWYGRYHKYFYKPSPRMLGLQLRFYKPPNRMNQRQIGKQKRKDRIQS